MVWPRLGEKTTIQDSEVMAGDVDLEFGGQGRVRKRPRRFKGLYHDGDWLLASTCRVFLMELGFLSAAPWPIWYDRILGSNVINRHSVGCWLACIRLSIQRGPLLITQRRMFSVSVKCANDCGSSPGTVLTALVASRIFVTLHGRSLSKSRARSTSN